MERINLFNEIVDEEFNNIEKHLLRNAKTLKLSRIAIKNLPKSISNKFVLPLYSKKEKDIETFGKLIFQPFSFLEYNGAKFSVFFHILYTTHVDYIQKKLQIDDLINSSFNKNLKLFSSIQQKLDFKKMTINDKILKLNRIDNKLEKHANYLKEEFEKKIKKFGNEKYRYFISKRTIDNLKKIRESQKIIKSKIHVLRNKKLYTDPQTFFKRMLKLFLGETGQDIINDLEKLGYNNKQDAKLGIKYLLFLLKIIDDNKNFSSPILTIMSSENFVHGYEKIDMLRVMAGHMFIHVILIEND